MFFSSILAISPPYLTSHLYVVASSLMLWNKLYKRKTNSLKSVPRIKIATHKIHVYNGLLQLLGTCQEWPSGMISLGNYLREQPFLGITVKILARSFPGKQGRSWARSMRALEVVLGKGHCQASNVVPRRVKSIPLGQRSIPLCYCSRVICSKELQ